MQICHLGVEAASRSGKLLRARRMFVPLVLRHECSRPTRTVRKASWSQTATHATPNLNLTVKMIWVVSLAIMVRECVASRRQNMGHISCAQRWCRWNVEAVSSSWSTRINGAVNPQLLQGTRLWQWRWHPWKFQGLQESHRSG